MKAINKFREHEMVSRKRNGMNGVKREWSFLGKAKIIIKSRPVHAHWKGERMTSEAFFAFVVLLAFCVSLDV